MATLNKRAFRLVTIDKNVKKCYLVDDYKTLTFCYSELTNSYLIGFKQYHRQMLISTKHFHLLGQTYEQY